MGLRRISISRTTPQHRNIMLRWWLSFLFFLTAYYLNILASVISGWRTPPMDPLPDLGHELLQPIFMKMEIKFGKSFIRHFPDACVLVLFLFVILYLIWNNAQRRRVISRRLFVVLGFILCFRAYCVTVTNLPDMRLVHQHNYINNSILHNLIKPSLSDAI